MEGKQLSLFSEEPENSENFLNANETGQHLNIGYCLNTYKHFAIILEVMETINPSILTMLMVLPVLGNIKKELELKIL
jgi:hypothetical protein